MSIFQHWQDQKDALRAAITDRMNIADVVYQVRHALLQAEQTALAEMDDDLLRQQAGVLMGCLKGSLGLLEANTASQIWLAQKSEKPKLSDRSPWLYAAVALVLLALYCGMNDEWISMALCIAGLVLGFWALMKERKAASAILPKDEVHVDIKVDVDRLFAVLDGQLRAMDRYLSDFSYLNDQAKGGSENADPMTLSRAAELMEALYDLEEGERAPVEEAARGLLSRLGMQAVDYCEDNSRLFNALPSKSVTRTLSPAIVSAEDQKLLRRGTAAVRIDAA